MHGINRIVKERILKLLQYFPAVAILGSRQCGKTTLAHEIADCWEDKAIYLDLERISDLAKLEDAVSYLEPLEESLIIIDEIQNRPALFPEIRGLIDSGRRKGIKNGRFLFLGSASYELLRQSGETLAGRIAYLELTPFRFDEVEVAEIDKLWCRGGFPDSFLAVDEDISSEWRRNFIDTYLTRDLSLFGEVSALPAMRNLLQMMAHLHGQVLNISQLVQSHEFSRSQINNYLDLFEQTFVIRRLQPFFKNVGKRLTKRPKLYLRDSGILHQLLNIPNYDYLCGHPMKGASWEGFVIEQILSILPNWLPYFYRTSHGAEIDLLLQNGSELLAFEIKASSAPTLSKGFYLARADIEPTKTFVISRTDEQWTTSENITYCNIYHLCELLSEYIN